MLMITELVKAEYYILNLYTFTKCLWHFRGAFYKNL